MTISTIFGAGIGMKLSILYVTFLLVIVCALPANAETWRTYHNERFGTTAQIPASWEPELPGPQNGDGLIFFSPDKHAKITVSGILNSLDESVQAENASFVKAREGEKVTYSKLGSNWAVASGTIGDNIFYRKQVMTCQDSIENHIWIEYPSAEKARYNPIVNHVASTLRGGKGWQTDSCR